MLGQRPPAKHKVFQLSGHQPHHPIPSPSIPWFSLPGWLLAAAQRPPVACHHLHRRGRRLQEVELFGQARSQAREQRVAARQNHIGEELLTPQRAMAMAYHGLQSGSTAWMTQRSSKKTGGTNMTKRWQPLDMLSGIDLVFLTQTNRWSQLVFTSSNPFWGCRGIFTTKTGLQWITARFGNNGCKRKPARKSHIKVAKPKLINS